MLTSQRLKVERDWDHRIKDQVHNPFWILRPQLEVWLIANCVSKPLLPILAEHTDVQVTTSFPIFSCSYVKPVTGSPPKGYNLRWRVTLLDLAFKIIGGCSPRLFPPSHCL